MRQKAQERTLPGPAKSATRGQSARAKLLPFFVKNRVGAKSAGRAGVSAQDANPERAQHAAFFQEKRVWTRASVGLEPGHGHARDLRFQVHSEDG